MPLIAVPNLTRPQNALEVEVTMRLTSESGVCKAIGTIAVKNSEVLVAGRKEPALFIEAVPTP
jgi:hypothetical protein